MIGCPSAASWYSFFAASVFSRKSLSRNAFIFFFLSLPCRYRFTRALPFFMMDSTSSRLAMLVSPGVVIASAPCAAP